MKPDYYLEEIIEPFNHLKSIFVRSQLNKMNNHLQSPYKYPKEYTYT